MADANDIVMEDHGSKGRYVMRSEAGAEAEMNFSKLGEHSIIIDQTAVPDAFRGQGVGLRLLADARAAGNRITPTCWFVRDELARLSPEWDDVRA